VEKCEVVTVADQEELLSCVLYFQAVLSALSGLTPILTLCMFYKIDFDYMFLLTMTIQCCDVWKWLDG
jgi:hypothetical protein